MFSTIKQTIAVAITGLWAASAAPTFEVLGELYEIVRGHAAPLPGEIGVIGAIASRTSVML